MVYVPGESVYKVPGVEVPACGDPATSKVDVALFTCTIKSEEVAVPIVVLITDLMMWRVAGTTGAAAQVGMVTVVLFNVTAASLAKSLPTTVEPPLSVIEAAARIVPSKKEFVPSVAELPTCQKTLQA
jgi:hypothetical protein